MRRACRTTSFPTFRADRRRRRAGAPSTSSSWAPGRPAACSPTGRVRAPTAGGWDHDPFIRIPIGWGRIMPKRLHDWGHDTELDPVLGIPAMECMRGRVIGGSSSINAMVHVRGDRGGFDRWAGYRLPRLAHSQVLPCCRRPESREGGASAWRVGTGPLKAMRATCADPLSGALLSSAAGAGLPCTEDCKGAVQEGFGVLQSTIRNGRRHSAAAACPWPALRRPNLTVRTKVLVTGLEFDGDRAVAVARRRGGRAERARAEGRTVPCAGALNTPQILMLSGIGDPPGCGRWASRRAWRFPASGARTCGTMPASRWSSRAVAKAPSFAGHAGRRAGGQSRPRPCRRKRLRHRSAERSDSVSQDPARPAGCRMSS